MTKADYLQKMFLFPINYSNAELWRVQMQEFWKRSYTVCTDGIITADELCDRVDELIGETSYEVVNSNCCPSFSDGDRRRRPEECKTY